MAVDAVASIITTLQASDTPLTVLRGSSRLRLYVVHHDEAHYVLKLIKLEEQKVRRAACVTRRRCWSRASLRRHTASSTSAPSPFLVRPCRAAHCSALGLAAAAHARAGHRRHRVAAQEAPCV